MSGDGWDILCSWLVNVIGQDQREIYIISITCDCVAGFCTNVVEISSILLTFKHQSNKGDRVVLDGIGPETYPTQHT